MNRMSWLATVIALLAAGCAVAEPTTTAATATEPIADSTTTLAVTTTRPVVSVDATFAIGSVVFGEQGWIEVVNTGSNTGNVSGFWIAIHPFYLELPSAIVEVGERVTISLQPEGTSALVHAAGLLPVLRAADGEVGLYSHGNFGDPTAIVDYVEWGSGGHFRSTVAVAAGIWDETRIVATSGDEGGLALDPDGSPVLLDADLAPVSTDG